MKLSKKISLILITSITLGLIILEFYNTVNIKNILKKDTNKYLNMELNAVIESLNTAHQNSLATATLKANAISEFFASRGTSLPKEMVKFSFINPIIKEKDTFSFSKMILNSNSTDKYPYFINNPAYEKISIYQKVNNLYINIFSNDKSSEKYLMNDSSIIKKIINNEIYYDRVYIDNSFYTCVYKPFKVNGEVAGIIFIKTKELESNILRKITLNTNLEIKSYIFIVNNKGKIIFSNNPQSNSIFMKDNFYVSTYYKPLDSYIYVSANINDFILKIDKMFIKNTALFLAILIIILSAFIFFYIKFQLKPIVYMTESLKKVSIGDLSQEIPIVNQNEIGELSIEYNKFLSQLRETIKYFNVMSRDILSKNKQLEEEIDNAINLKLKIIKGKKVKSKFE